MGKPYIVSLHGMLLERSIAHHRLRKRLFLSLAGNGVLRGAAALHFTTQAEFEQAAPYLPAGPEKAVIPLTIENALLRDSPGPNRWREYFPAIPDTWPRLLFLSRIHPVKNLPSLLGALPQLLREFPGLHLVVAGSGEASYVRRMHELAGALVAESRVVFVGAISGEAKAHLIRSSTIMTIPSFHENFGMAIAEGLACGVPTLVTPGLGIGAEVMSWGAGFRCGESSTAVATALSSALQSRAGLLAAGARGHDWAVTTLSAEAVAPRLADLYHGALRKRH
jgi:glycosyltransferase involved in cell wall biosynthesis